jgi:hypothetical protein
MKRIFLILLPALALAGLAAQESNVTAPDAYFGFEPGTDRKLFTYEKLISYLHQLDEESPRIKMEQIGESPMGRPMYIAFISSEENINNLEPLREINRELALNPGLGREALQDMVERGRVFLLATLSMHASEVGPAQSAALVAHEFASTTDERKLEWLDNVVYMMVPSHNPDGMDMIVNYYNEHLGSPYEGASLPRVYHKYVGHNNNRDFVSLTQEDTRAISRITSDTWFPQVMVEKHQMGSTGTRYFVPPNHDPVAENVPAGIFQWIGVFGQHMATDMTLEGLAGVSQHYLFDNYWPGSTETCIWKNVIGFLTEAASVQTATPIYIEPTELRVGGKGLSEYKKSTNMLMPWEGGWWRLGDIVEYELVSTRSIIKTASTYREEILEFRNRMCREQVELGRSEPPYYYILPSKQHDPGELVNLVSLLQEHGVDLFTLTGQVELEGRVYRQGDVVIPLAHPFRPFIKEVMETQEFPERHYTPGGELIRPYDITSWSLPLHRQVVSHEIRIRSELLEGSLDPVSGIYSLYEEPETGSSLLLPVSINESFRAAFRALQHGFRVERLSQPLNEGGRDYGKGSFVVRPDSRKQDQWEELIKQLRFNPGWIGEETAVESVPLQVPRIALVETHFHDMDAGWTRYLFDSYHIPFAVLHPEQFKDTDLAGEYDVILFPDTDKSVLMTGKQQSGGDYYLGSYHPDVVKGMEKEGFEKLMDFSDKGGIVLAWGRSGRLFEGILKMKSNEVEKEFQLPFRDLSPDLAKEGLYVPGSLVRVDLAGDHPLTLGMPGHIGVFSRGRPVFRTSVPLFDMDRRVIGTYPEKDLLLSGYASGEEKMGNTAAVLWMRKGKGQFVLYGFNPQFRASTQAAFKLLFNGLLLSRID